MNFDLSATRMVRRLPALLSAGFLLAAGCADTRDIVAPDVAARHSIAGGDRMFNPQPDPPKEIFRFLIDTPELIDNPELRGWTGTFVNGDGVDGVLLVNHLLPAVQRGGVLHLRQTWTFTIGDTTLPAVQLDGILNLNSSHLVLNGRDVTGNIVQVHGMLTSAGGIGSIGGAVMFNPQPDPPKFAG